MKANNARLREQRKEVRQTKYGQHSSQHEVRDKHECGGDARFCRVKIEQARKTPEVQAEVNRRDQEDTWKCHAKGPSQSVMRSPNISGATMIAASFISVVNNDPNVVDMIIAIRIVPINMIGSTNKASIAVRAIRYPVPWPSARISTPTRHSRPTARRMAGISTSCHLLSVASSLLLQAQVRPSCSRSPASLPPASCWYRPARQGR